MRSCDILRYFCLLIICVATFLDLVLNKCFFGNMFVHYLINERKKLFVRFVNNVVRNFIISYVFVS